MESADEGVLNSFSISSSNCCSLFSHSPADVETGVTMVMNNGRIEALRQTYAYGGGTFIRRECDDFVDFASNARLRIAKLHSSFRCGPATSTGSSSFTSSVVQRANKLSINSHSSGVNHAHTSADIQSSLIASMKDLVVFCAHYSRMCVVYN